MGMGRPSRCRAEVWGMNRELLHDVFTTALEGGIGYWSVATEYHWARPGATGTVSEAADLGGFYAIIEETEIDQPPIQHRIDAEVIRLGIRRAFDYATQDRKLNDYQTTAVVGLFAGWDGADYDADTADIVVQFGLFGEIIYG